MNESANTIRYMKGEHLVTQIDLLTPNTTYSKLMEDVVNQYPRLFNGEELSIYFAIVLLFLIYVLLLYFIVFLFFNVLCIY